MKLGYRILGVDYNLSLNASSLKVHHIFVKDEKSLERCLDVYFKTFQAIIKAKSKIDDASVLMGKIELETDRGNQTNVLLREAAINAG